MSKIFDNSGKNTENEIYDTSHRQYWAPPGHAAFKDNLGLFLGIVLAILIVGAIDVFLLHPITANVPEDLSGTPYEQATVLSVAPDVLSGKKEIILAEQDGELHLLMFDFSLFERLKLQEDVPIEAASKQTLRLGPWPFFADVTVEENQISDVNVFGSLIPNSNRLANAAYILIGIVLYLIPAYLWERIRDKMK